MADGSEFAAADPDLMGAQQVVGGQDSPQPSAAGYPAPIRSVPLKGFYVLYPAALPSGSAQGCRTRAEKVGS